MWYRSRRFFSVRIIHPASADRKVLDMKAKLIAIFIGISLFALPAHAGFFDSLFKSLTGDDKESGTAELTEDKIISGLKEALSVATKNAVKTVSTENGFFNNPAIKIEIPDKLKKVTDVVKKLGFEQTVNDFELSMNRAMEKAAPEAADIFTDAIKAMSFSDARGILNGGDTAATDFFSAKTSEQLYHIFKPMVSASMDQVKVTQYYKAVEKKYASMVPLGGINSFELDDYVTKKGLEGLFAMMAKEEAKIRKDPAGRTTALLKQVFGRLND